MEAYEGCISKLRKSQSNRRKISLRKVEGANFSKEVRTRGNELPVVCRLLLSQLDPIVVKHIIFIISFLILFIACPRLLCPKPHL